MIRLPRTARPIGHVQRGPRTPDEIAAAATKRVMADFEAGWPSRPTEPVDPIAYEISRSTRYHAGADIELACECPCRCGAAMNGIPKENGHDAYILFDVVHGYGDDAKPSISHSHVCEMCRTECAGARIRRKARLHHTGNYIA